MMFAARALCRPFPRHRQDFARVEFVLDLTVALEKEVLRERVIVIRLQKRSGDQRLG